MRQQLKNNESRLLVSKGYRHSVGLDALVKFARTPQGSTQSSLPFPDLMGLVAKRSHWIAKSRLYRCQVCLQAVKQRIFFRTNAKLPVKPPMRPTSGDSYFVRNHMHGFVLRKHVARNCELTVSVERLPISMRRNSQRSGRGRILCGVQAAERFVEDMMGFTISDETPKIEETVNHVRTHVRKQCNETLSGSTLSLQNMFLGIGLV
jgi:hypothetical protein